MSTQCNSKPLGFEGHCSRRRLVAKKLIFLLVFLRVPSWIFFFLLVGLRHGLARPSNQSQPLENPFQPLSIEGLHGDQG